PTGVSAPKIPIVGGDGFASIASYHIFNANNVDVTNSLGISISSSGVVSGTAVQSGTYTIKVTLKDVIFDPEANNGAGEFETFVSNPAYRAVPDCTLNIAKATTITITPTSGLSWPIGKPPPLLTFSVSGLLNGDTIGPITYTSLNTTVNGKTVVKTQGTFTI